MDVGWWQGRGSQAIMLWLNRQSTEYQRRVACHEAGHFLAAYLLELPISSYSTRYSTVAMMDGTPTNGQSLYTEGNLVINNVVDLATDTQQEQKSLLQKLTTVAVAGIVAEEMLCEGTAQGGSSDYQQLRQLLRYQENITPQTSVNYGLQERWAKLRARDLLRPHQSTLEALATVMNEKASLDQCLATLDTALKPQLNRPPSPDPSIIEKNLVIQTLK